MKLQLNAVNFKTRESSNEGEHFLKNLADI